MAFFVLLLSTSHSLERITYFLKINTGFGGVLVLTFEIQNCSKNVVTNILLYVHDVQVVSDFQSRPVRQFKEYTFVCLILKLIRLRRIQISYIFTGAQISQPVLVKPLQNPLTRPP